MIYRLFRKEASVRSTLDLMKPELSESRFIEEISRMIKLVRRRERLCVELEEGRAGEEAHREGEQLAAEAEGVLGVLRGFGAEAYFSCKAYLYTAFMRITEIADKGRVRCRSEGRALPDRTYEELKRITTDLYNRQAAEEKYDVVELFQVVLRLQAARLAMLLPKRKVAPLEPISNSTKILDQLRQPTEPIDLRKKSVSTEMFKPSALKLEEIVNKKLGPDLATSKRLEERKREKERERRPRVVNLFRLYDVLEIRAPPLDRPLTLKEELQTSMNERNQLVREAIRQWERRWAAKSRRERP